MKSGDEARGVAGSRGLHWMGGTSTREDGKRVKSAQIERKIAEFMLSRNC